MGFSYSRFNEPDETSFDDDVASAIRTAYDDGADALVPLRDLCKHLGELAAVDALNDTLHFLVSDDDQLVTDAAREDLAKPEYADALSAAEGLVSALKERDAKKDRAFHQRFDALIAQVSA